MRLLQLIDVIAAWRLPFDIRDLHREYVDRFGERARLRTIRRDVELLARFGLLEPAGH